MQKLIQIDYATTLQQLRHALDRVTRGDESTLYVMNNQNQRVRMELKEEVLTDGSIVYNLILS